MSLILDKKWFGLFCLVILSFIVRTWNIGFREFNLEEAMTWHLTTLPLGIDFFSACALENTPPLFQLLLKGWTFFGGDNEVSLRLLSAIFGSISVFAIFQLGFQFYNIRVAWIAALFMTFAPRAVEVSRIARSESLLILLILLSTFFGGRLTQKGNVRDLICFSAFSILACYTHYMGLVFFLAQAILFLTFVVFKRKKRREFPYPYFWDSSLPV